MDNHFSFTVRISTNQRNSIIVHLIDWLFHAFVLKSQSTKWTRVLTVKEKWLSMYNRNLHDCIHISIPVKLRFEHLSNWKTRSPQRWIRIWNRYKFTIPIFIDLKRPLNWLKSKITKIEENLYETVNHCPKWNVYKFIARNDLYWTCPLSRGQFLGITWVGT